MVRTLIALAAAFLLSVPSAYAASTLKVASNPTWPPMEFMNLDKQVIGYDADIITAIAKEMGSDVEFLNTAWEGIFAVLENGNVDVLASCVTITDARKKKYLFSEPYYLVRQALVVPTGSSIKQAADLKGKTVGIQIGTTANVALKKIQETVSDVTIKSYDDVGLVFEDLKNGRIDAAMCDDPVAKYYASRKEGYADTMHLAFSTEDTEPIGFVVRKDRPELVDAINKGLAAIRANGVEKEISVKWFGE